MRSTDYKIETRLVEITEKELIELVRTAAVDFVKSDYMAVTHNNKLAVPLTVEKDGYGGYVVIVQLKDVAKVKS